MDRNLETIAAAAARECVRQGVDEAALVRLLSAHLHASELAGRSPLPDLPTVLELGRLVEPQGQATPVRRTPVAFASGGSAVAHDRVLPTLVRMFEHLDADTDPDAFTKAFLDVHPFTDGNGRVAWLLYNWLRGGLGDPVSLPDYYQEGTA